MRRVRLVAPLLVVAALAAGCGGGSSKPAANENPASSATTPPAASATAPADVTAAKAEITKNWETFLHSGTPHAVAIKLLENGDNLGPALRKATAEDKATGGARTASVKSITFTSPTAAQVNYKLHAAGRVLNSSGDAVLQDGTWKVSETTFCTLVILGNGGRAVPGCQA